MTRLLVSALVLLHVAAVASAPWAVQLRTILSPDLPPGAIVRDARGREIPFGELSPEQYPPLQPIVPVALWDFFFHYTNMLYINHGYDFFAPDPGVGHVLAYELFDENNQKIGEGQFPDRRDQWPRLFYHRHMMLVDQSADPNFGPVRWETRIAKQLMEANDAARVDMKLLVRHLPTLREIQEGGKLDDPSRLIVESGPVSQLRSDQLPPLPPLPSQRPSPTAAVEQLPAGAAPRMGQPMTPARIPGVTR